MKTSAEVRDFEAVKFNRGIAPQDWRERVAFKSGYDTALSKDPRVMGLVRVINSLIYGVDQNVPKQIEDLKRLARIELYNWESGK